MVSGGDLNTARDSNSRSRNTNCFYSSWRPTTPGSYSNTVEYYNCTSWSEQAEINEAREFVTGSGTQTAALVFGGRDGPNTSRKCKKDWNGTSWTETTSKWEPARRGVNSSVAPYTAVLAFGGYPASWLFFKMELWKVQHGQSKLK